MNAVVNIEDIRGAIREKLIEDGCEDDVENALSDLEKHVYYSDNYAEDK